MKSAYELAMERLNAQEPGAGRPLSDEQKESLAEIDRKYKARIAEREVFLKKQLDEVRAAGNRGEEEQLLKQINAERERLEEEMEAEKDKIRQSA